MTQTWPLKQMSRTASVCLTQLHKPLLGCKLDPSILLLHQHLLQRLICTMPLLLMQACLLGMGPTGGHSCWGCRLAACPSMHKASDTSC